MLKNTFLVTLLVGLVLAGCGSNSPSKADAGPGAHAGSGANAGNGGGGSSGSNGTGTAGTGSDGGMPATCDKTVTSVAKCGSQSCTAQSTTAAMFCQVNCCTSDNKCGTKSTSSQATGTTAADCTPPATADTRCDVLVPAQLKAFQSVGCCMADGNCGAILFGMCLDPASLAGQFGVDAGPPNLVKCTDAAKIDAGTSGNDAGN